MDTAKQLFRSLERHNALFKNEEFLEFLEKMKVSYSDGAFIPKLKQVQIRGYEPETLVSIEGIFNNKRAHNLKMTLGNRLKQINSELFGIHSSETLARKVMQNKHFVQAMYDSKCPHSILGKVKTFTEYDGDTEIIIKPILCIPNLEIKNMVYNWESENTSYAKDLMGVGIPRPIYNFKMRWLVGEEQNI